MFIGNLPDCADEAGLREKFGSYNPVSILVPPPKDGFARGFGFVTVKESQVKTVLKDFLRCNWDGKQIRVTRAKADFSQRTPAAAKDAKADSKNAGKVVEKKEEKKVDGVMKIRSRRFQRGAGGTIHTGVGQSKEFDSSSDEEDANEIQKEDSDSEEELEKPAPKVTNSKIVAMSSDDEDDSDDSDSDEEGEVKKVDVVETTTAAEEDSDSDEEESADESAGKTNSDTKIAKDSQEDENDNAEESDSDESEVDVAPVVVKKVVKATEGDISSDDDEKSLSEGEESDDDEVAEVIPGNTKTDVTVANVDVEEINEERNAQAALLSKMLGSTVTVKKAATTTAAATEVVQRPSYANHLVQKRWVPGASSTSAAVSDSESEDEAPVSTTKVEKVVAKPVEKEESDGDSEDEGEEVVDDKKKVEEKVVADAESSSSDSEDENEEAEKVETEADAKADEDDSESDSDSEVEKEDEGEKKVEAKKEVAKKVVPKKVIPVQDSVAQALATLQVPLESLRPQPSTCKSDRAVERAKKIRENMGASKTEEDDGENADKSETIEAVEEKSSSASTSGLVKERSALETIASLTIQPDGSAIDKDGNVMSRKEYRSLRSACKGSRMGYKRQAAALARGAEQLKKSKIAKEAEEKRAADNQDNEDEKKVTIVHDAPVENAKFEVACDFKNVFRDAVDAKLEGTEEKKVEAKPAKVGLSWLQNLRKKANAESKMESMKKQETSEVSAEVPSSSAENSNSISNATSSIATGTKRSSDSTEARQIFKKPKKAVAGFFKTDASEKMLNKKRDMVMIDGKKKMRAAQRKTKARVM